MTDQARGAGHTKGPTAAIGYPFLNHRSQAVVMGLAEHKPVTEADRVMARARLEFHLSRAAWAAENSLDWLYEAHVETADDIAHRFGVAWNDPAVVRDPREEQGS